MAAGAGFEPTTLRSKGFDSTNAPPRPTYLIRDIVVEVYVDVSLASFCQPTYLKM